MKSLRRWPIGLLATLLAGLLMVSELNGASRVTVDNPTALYLLAQYKLAAGDAASGVELMDRALAARHPLPPIAPALSACTRFSAVPMP
jgi:hypothetical protein